MYRPQVSIAHFASGAHGVSLRRRLEETTMLTRELGNALVAHLEGSVAGGVAFIKHETARLDEAKPLLELSRCQRCHLFEVPVEGRLAHGRCRCKALDGYSRSILSPEYGHGCAQSTGTAAGIGERP